MWACMTWLPKSRFSKINWTILKYLECIHVGVGMCGSKFITFKLTPLTLSRRHTVHQWPLDAIISYYIILYHIISYYIILYPRISMNFMVEKSTPLLVKSQSSIPNHQPVYLYSHGKSPFLIGKPSINRPFSKVQFWFHRVLPCHQRETRSLLSSKLRASRWYVRNYVRIVWKGGDIE